MLPTLDEEKYTLMLNLETSAVDVTDIQTKAQTENFKVKSDFHVTIIGFQPGKKIKAAFDTMPDHEKTYKLNKLKTLIAETNWSFSLLPEKYHIKKNYDFKDYATGQTTIETRESYIQMVNLPALPSFYAQLNKLFRTSLETQVAHITLCTKGSDPIKSQAGIGINSKDEFQALQPQKI